MTTAAEIRTALKPRFTYDDAAHAADVWGCNCGPAAVAAICRLTLDELRPHLGDFEKKRYTNPTLMWQILRNIGVAFEVSFPASPIREAPFAGVWPRFGLARIQWSGPWLNPGVPVAARYRHTHWVGACNLGEGSGLREAVGIWDVNCLNNGDGWVSLGNWSELAVPAILKQCYPKASGGWYVTHVVEVKR